MTNQPENRALKPSERIQEIINDAGFIGITNDARINAVIQYLDETSKPSPASGVEKCIPCSGEWHTLTYEAYTKKHGAYPRSCPLCHNFFLQESTPPQSTCEHESTEDNPKDECLCYGNETHSSCPFHGLNKLISTQPARELPKNEEIEIVNDIRSVQTWSKEEDNWNAFQEGRMSKRALMGSIAQRLIKAGYSKQPKTELVVIDEKSAIAVALFVLVNYKGLNSLTHKQQVEVSFLIGKEMVKKFATKPGLSKETEQ